MDDVEESDGAPPREVRRAFGVDGSAEHIASGQGQSFRVENLVFKPAPEARECEWIGDALDAVVEDGFRVARPVRAANGAWSFDGWSATRCVEGESTNERWAAVVSAGANFHRALRDLPRPGFLDDRTHQWAIGDRVAFGEAQAALPEPIAELVEQLLAPVASNELASQIIHGDLTENVLLAPGVAPAIIDFSPYFRPLGFATAIVAVDAIVWHDAPLALIDLVQPTHARFELLACALVFRLVAAALPRANNAAALQVQASAHRPLVDHTVDQLARD
jgi:uncharacterized protein (TIGR02569 family)